MGGVDASSDALPDFLKQAVHLQGVSQSFLYDTDQQSAS